MTEKETCPVCMSPMKSGMAPCRVKGKLVGKFDAMICTVCKHYFFTERDYHKIVKESLLLGLIGPAPHMRELKLQNVLQIEKIPDRDSDIIIDTPSLSQNNIMA